MQDFSVTISKEQSGYVVTSPGTGERHILPWEPPSPVPEECGNGLFQHFFADPILSAYRRSRPDRLLLTVPEELFDWRWRWLHDGSQSLALAHPLLLFCAETPPSSSLLVKQPPVRILLTLSRTTIQPGTLDDEERVVREFRQRNADLVQLRVERGSFTFKRLESIFRNSSTPFHIWHHSGGCSPSLLLELDGGPLSHDKLHYLLSLQRELRCLILHTSVPAPLASALRSLNLPFTIYFASSSQTNDLLPLLRSFYQRLLTDDVAIAGMLAQREAYQHQNPQWSSPGMLANTSQLYLVQQRPGSVQKEFPARIVMFKANPRSEPARQQREELRLDREVREIEQIQREYQGCFVLKPYPAAHPSDVSRSLLEHRPHILHFSGHGLRRSGKLAFVKEDGETAAVTFQTFVDWLFACETLRCVVLNACYTAPLARALSEHIDCAIGMNEDIGDNEASNFSSMFYRALAKGESVAEAFRWGCSQIGSQSEDSMPRLYTRDGVNPEEIFFVQSYYMKH